MPALIKGYLPTDELPDVDVIVVTADYYFEEIKDKLSKKVDCPIISIGEILSTYTV